MSCCFVTKKCPERVILNVKKLLLLVFILKDIFYRYAEGSSYLKGKGQRRRILAGFDGDYCLAGDPRFVGQLLLRHLVVFKAKPSKIVAEPVTAHPLAPVRIEPGLLLNEQIVRQI
jgi:hypothetical protein